MACTELTEQGGWGHEAPTKAECCDFRTERGLHHNVPGFRYCLSCIKGWTGCSQLWATSGCVCDTAPLHRARGPCPQVPGRYQLSVPLPYGVDDSKGRAKYDKARQVLEVTLPVVPPPPPPRPRAAPGGEEAAGAAAAAPCAMGSPAVDVSDDLRGIDQSSVTSSAVCSGVKGSSSGGDGGKGNRGGAAPGQAAEAAGPGNGRAEEGTSRGRGEAREDAVAEGGSGQGEGEGTEKPQQQQQQEEEGSGEGGMTENERRWRELHARQVAEAAEEEDGSGSGAGGHGGDEDAGVGMGREPKAVEAGAKEAVVEAAPAVMLRPRLNRELAMELD